MRTAADERLIAALEAALGRSEAERDRLTARLTEAEQERDEAHEGQTRDATLAARLAYDLAAERVRVRKLRDLAKAATSQAAAPDYDEEAIRESLWTLARAALAGERGDDA